MLRNALLALGCAAFLVVFGAVGATAQTITRGPYLQQATESSMILRWRTDAPTDSEVNYGAAPGALGASAGSGTATTEHEVELVSLSADTRYYYSVGTSATVLAGDDANHFFTTSPVPGTAVPTRIWVLGDSGTANGNARAVRDAYLAQFSLAETDLWLMLGDNAYNDETDTEYQAAGRCHGNLLWPTALPEDDLRRRRSGASRPRPRHEGS
jgi:hypothetical protein